MDNNEYEVGDEVEVSVEGKDYPCGIIIDKNDEGRLRVDVGKLRWVDSSSIKRVTRKNGSLVKRLRVVHIPQMGANDNASFTVEVDSEKEAKLVSDAIGNQHLWLFDNGYIPDYSNIIYVEVYEDDEWLSYEKDGMDWDEYVEEKLS
jgi:hypothetical protein